MVQIDEQGQVIGGNRAAVNAAGFQIHSAVHSARPDVHAACHAHSKYGKAWSAFGKPVDMLNQDSCIFWNDHSVYSSFGGVVLEANEGVRIAEALGPRNRSVILQNHGLLTAGGTVDEAAYLFTLLERTCEVQLLVESAGLEKRVVNEEEAKYTWEFNADPVSDFDTSFHIIGKLTLTCLGNLVYGVSTRLSVRSVEVPRSPSGSQIVFNYVVVDLLIPWVFFAL